MWPFVEAVNVPRTAAATAVVDPPGFGAATDFGAAVVFGAVVVGTATVLGTVVLGAVGEKSGT